MDEFKYSISWLKNGCPMHRENFGLSLQKVLSDRLLVLKNAKADLDALPSVVNLES